MALRLKNVLLCLAIAAAAFLYYYFVTRLALWFLFDASISDHIPTAIDYLQYWKEVYNFRSCAAFTGYFGHEELLSTLNKLGIDSPGASHGIFNPIFYSIFSLFTWQFDTPIYVNLALTSLGLALYCLLAGPALKRTWLVVLAVLSLYPIYSLNAYNSCQSAHFLLACLVGGLLARLLEVEDPKFRRRLWLALLAAVVVGSLLRKNWALFLVPLALLPQASTKRRGLLLGCALAGALVLSACFDAARSPYPYPEFTEDLRPYVLPALAHGDFSVLWRQIAINMRVLDSFVAKGDFDTIYGLFLLVAGLVLLADMPPDARRARLRLFGLVVLGISVASAAAIYYVFQIMLLKIVLQAFLVVTLGLMRYLSPRSLAAFLVVNILFMPSFLGQFRLVGQEYLYAPEKRQSIENFRKQTAPFFAKTSPDRWKNTVLIFSYTPELLGLPPCVNIMDTWESFLRERGYRVRAGFVLVADPAVEKRLMEHNALRKLASTTAGRLYAVE